jgi:hypothetical protein
LQEHQVTFGKKHKKEGSMTYQSFKSLLQLTNWQQFTNTTHFLSLVQGKKKCKMMKMALVKKVQKNQKMMEV